MASEAVPLVPTAAASGAAAVGTAQIKFAVTAKLGSRMIWAGHSGRLIAGFKLGHPHFRVDRRATRLTEGAPEIANRDGLWAWQSQAEAYEN